jgi:VacB/RNase II family 3'-5' exoribonuclease
MRYPVDLKAKAYSVMKDYGFIPEFPKGVLDEICAIMPKKLLGSQKGSRDLRGLLWSSIDNPDSKDLDQLEYCEHGNNDEIAVKVAIADVDLFVPRDSRTDRHAAHNGTSVYTGVETFPMLPEQLSEDLSSLLPGQDRLALIVEFEVPPDGELRHGDVYRGLVANKAKLAYDEVGEWLEGTGPLPIGVSNIPGMEEQVRLQMEAALRLNRHRTELGALDLETLEPRAVVDKGLVRDLIIDKKNRARSLIEEFMIATNETMVDHIGKSGFPMIQRVVRVPKYWDKIVDTAARYGWILPADPDSKSLAEFLDRQRKADPDHFPDLSLTVVKLMGPGEYVVINPGGASIGHFGLAILDYTHATAPNRRYADIVNQRLAKSILSGDPPPYSPEELADLGAWLTDRDKASQKVERFMRKAAAAVILRDRIGEIFDGFVTGVTVHGTFVRIISPPAEGKIVTGAGGLSVGQKVKVRLVNTDPHLGHIDFEKVLRFDH